MNVDLTGREIEVGDKVAWAAVAGRSAYIRTGKVTKLNEGGGFYAVVENAGALSWRGAPDKAIRITFADRALIIEKNTP